ncbi:MAG: formyltransferase [Planctomycetota bacterium]
MRIIAMAYHNIGCAALKALLELKENVVAVFTHEDNPDENIWFESVEKLAVSRNIPVYKPENPNKPEVIKIIKKYQPDIIFSFYYRHLVGEEILSIPSMGCINLHGSLLPKYRGRCPANWVILHGEKETGLTLHYMVKKADAGAIIASLIIPISSNDTAFTLMQKFPKAAYKLVKEIYPLIKAGKAPRIIQDHSQATYFGGRKPEDGKTDWNQTNVQIHNLVRAVTHPYPGAFGFLRNRKIFLWEVKPVIQERQLQPGTIFISRKTLNIATGKGAIRVISCQFEGDKEFDSKEFVRRYSIGKGELIT